MKPTKIADGVYEVGVIDWNIRDFHGYSTDRGTSYNAYLVIDERVALIDTVKAPFADQLIANISQVIDPQKIDVVVSNHTEMDHSGALPRIMHRVGEDKPLYCSKMGARNLASQFPNPWKYHPVKEGETLSLGKRTLTFMETRMIHWPDSMFTYLNEDHILFSSDGFGQHYAGFEKFDDQAGTDLMEQAKKYYANILMLYAPRILKLIEKVVASGIRIDMICPDHGVIWRKDPARIRQEWKALAREALEVRHRGDPGRMVVSFNRWFQDGDYRRDLSDVFQGEFTDESMGRVSWEGGGSSFGEAEGDPLTLGRILRRWPALFELDRYRQIGHYLKRLRAKPASEMAVLDRWKLMDDEPRFRAVFRDPEVVELSRELFGILDGTEVFARACAAEGASTGAEGG